MNCSRIVAAGIAAMALGGALPSIASAEDYCVAPNGSCGVNNFQKLQPALDQAASTQETDRVLLGEGTYVAPAPSTGFSYNELGSQVEIAGVGRGRTVLTAQPGSSGHVLSLSGGADSSIHDLTLAVPSQVDGNFTGLALWNAARRVEITAADAQNLHFYGAVIKSGGTLEDSSVTLKPDAENTGIYIVTPTEASITGSTITAHSGIVGQGPARVARSRVIGGNHAIYQDEGKLNVSDSLVRLTGQAGVAISADSGQDGPASITVDGTTVIVPDTLDASGICAFSQTGWKQPADVVITNSVIRGGLSALCAAEAYGGSATIKASFSDYEPGGNIALGAGAKIEESHVTNVGDAGFADPANGDFRLRPGSRLVDIGDPDVAQGLDLDGNPRLADGNGDGFARHDLGAFELQPQPQPHPEPQADTQPPLITGLRARRADVSYKLSESARVIVKIQRRLAGHRARYRTLGKVAKPAKQGANRLRLSRRIRAKDVRPGRYRAVMVAVDAAGNHSSAKVATFKVSR